MTYDDVRARCIEAWAQAGLSDKTIHAYLLVLDRAERWLERRRVTVLTATPRQIREYAETVPRTRASRVQLRTALARCWEACERPDGSAGAVRVPTKPKYGCRALSEPQAAHLARFAARSRGPEGLAVMLALYAGLRREEIARLRWDQLDLEAGWLRVVGKGDVTAELPIHHELAERLARHPRSGAFVFPGDRGRPYVTPATIWTWTRRVSRSALREEVSPHRLRHTAIATLNDSLGDLRVAQSFARHASPETTVIYTRVTRRRLERAVQSLDYDAAVREAL